MIWIWSVNDLKVIRNELLFIFHEFFIFHNFFIFHEFKKVWIKTRKMKNSKVITMTTLLFAIVVKKKETVYWLSYQNMDIKYEIDSNTMIKWGENPTRSLVRKWWIDWNYSIVVVDTNRKKTWKKAKLCYWLSNY